MRIFFFGFLFMCFSSNAQLKKVKFLMQKQVTIQPVLSVIEDQGKYYYFTKDMCLYLKYNGINKLENYFFFYGNKLEESYSFNYNSDGKLLFVKKNAPFDEFIIIGRTKSNKQIDTLLSSSKGALVFTYNPDSTIATIQYTSYSGNIYIDSSSFLLSIRPCDSTVKKIFFEYDENRKIVSETDSFSISKNVSDQLIDLNNYFNILLSLDTNAIYKIDSLGWFRNTPEKMSSVIYFHNKNTLVSRNQVKCSIDKYPTCQKSEKYSNNENFKVELGAALDILGLSEVNYNPSTFFFIKYKQFLNTPSYTPLILINYYVYDFYFSQYNSPVVETRNFPYNLTYTQRTLLNQTKYMSLNYMLNVIRFCSYKNHYEFNIGLTLGSARLLLDMFVHEYITMSTYYDLKTSFLNFKKFQLDYNIQYLSERNFTSSELPLYLDNYLINKFSLRFSFAKRLDFQFKLVSNITSSQLNSTYACAQIYYSEDLTSLFVSKHKTELVYYHNKYITSRRRDRIIKRQNKHSYKNNARVSG